MKGQPLRHWIPACAGMTILLTCICFAAEKPSISIKASLDKAFITVGDRVQYKIEVRHDPKIEILGFNTAVRLRDFEIKETRDIAPFKENNQLVEGKTFVLTAYTLGEYVIDPVTIEYRGPDGKMKEIKTNKLYVTVESVEKSKAIKKDIRDIKTVISLPSELLANLAIFAGILLALAGTVLTWIFFQRRDLIEKFFAPPLKPHEEAFQALTKLQDSGLLVRGKVREYYFQMSEILKRYFQKRFEFGALEQTSSEILEEFIRLELNPESLSLIRGFLESSDFVKFAKFQPEPVLIQKDYKTAWNIIEKTKPVEESVQPV